MRRWLPVLVPVLLLAACATKPGTKTGSSSGNTTFALPTQPVIGRILTADNRRNTAIVTLNSEGMTIPRAENWPLVSRRDDLTITARLVGTVHRMGSTLGVVITEGLPQPGEEVTLAPPSPPLIKNAP